MQWGIRCREDRVSQADSDRAGGVESWKVCIGTEDTAGTCIYMHEFVNITRTHVHTCMYVKTHTHIHTHTHTHSGEPPP